MKKRKVSLIFLLLGFMLIFVIACEKDEMADNYVNDEYGYTFEIPETWKGKKEKVKIIEDDEGRVVTFAYLFNSDGSEYQQEFFSISAMSKEDYEEAINDPPYTGDFLAERDSQVYVLHIPLDNIILDRETINEFGELHLSVEEIKERFYLNYDSELLPDKILELQGQISKKDEEINRLKKVNSAKDAQIKELWENLNMVRFSSYARLEDYSESFDNLKEVYKINSNYEIIDDWYLITDDYFEIELLGYEDAIKIDFYTLRLESGEGQILIFSDTDPMDGWVYANDSISEIIEKHSSSRGFSFVPFFVIYTEVTLEDGNIIRTPKLPIYNR